MKSYKLSVSYLILPVTFMSISWRKETLWGFIHYKVLLFTMCHLFDVLGCSILNWLLTGLPGIGLGKFSRSHNLPTEIAHHSMMIT